MLDTNIWKDNPILYYSLIKDNYDDFVIKLFNYSSIMNTPNLKKETLLHYCSFYGMIDKYYALTNMGAEIQETSEKNNLLHYASFSGKDDFLIVELIKSGISPTEKNIYGHTSVHYAANERICHYLNLWCIRNNIKITELLDNMGNTVAHMSHCLRHNLSAQYWTKNYPILKEIKNKSGLLHNEVAIQNLNFCHI